ncbi:O-antigen ligase family protein [Dehalobacter sp.]|uniref:O-antigen ligase family protein n=1 Tax=Dehalobacter sp. TaxID=1962289 RepID=UPI0025882CF8|nr:O-antigen ligase family protein [Dehalobacter sp.]MDJ0304949.1 O-antigen ligase family protein [Dehalobacter sp.]
MFTNKEKINEAVFSLDFWAAAILVYWCNIYFFLHNTHFIVQVFNIAAYVATVCVIICGYNKIDFRLLMLILTALLVSLISLLLPAGSQYLSEYLLPFLLAGIIGICMTGIIKEPKYILFWWFAFTLVLSLLSIKSFLGASEAFEYYMATAYIIFYFFAFIAILAVDKVKWYHFVTLAFCAFAIIMIGTRGAIIAVLLTMITVILFYNAISIKKLCIAICFLAVIFSVTYYLIFTDEGLTLLKSFIDHIGIQSRMVWLLEESRLTLSKERIDIYGALWNGFLQSPILGYGLGGDMYIITKALGEYYYSHNFILEAIIDFGIVGIILIISLFALFAKSAMSCQDPNWKKIGYLFFICCFFPKIFSFTFLHPMTLPTIAVLLKINKLNTKDADQIKRKVRY